MTGKRFSVKVQPKMGSEATYFIKKDQKTLLSKINKKPSFWAGKWLILLGQIPN